jgi:D-alanyl-D-alanine carboxypeptidase
MNHWTTLLIGAGVALLSLAAAPKARKSPEALLKAALAEGVPHRNTAAVLEIVTPYGHWAVAQGVVDTATPSRAVTPSDRFRIASTSKLFVAVVALQLVEAGTLNLDDLAQKWLPDEVVETLANADNVTIRHLLQMRSGVPDYLDDDFMEAVWADPERKTPYTPTEALAYAYGKRANFKPGAKFIYCNSNYLLVQLVLEKVTRKPLHRLVRQQILEPLGLKNSYTQLHESLPGGFVHGYADFPDDGALNYDVTDVNDGAGLGDGALVSTTADLITFYQALFHAQSLLNEDSLAELLDFQETDEADNEGYGLGIYYYETEWGAAFTHDGSVLGFTSLALYLPAYLVTMAILCAHEAGDLYPVVDVALNVVLEG